MSLSAQADRKDIRRSPISEVGLPKLPVLSFQGASFPLSAQIRMVLKTIDDTMTVFSKSERCLYRHETSGMIKSGEGHLERLEEDAWTNDSDRKKVFNSSDIQTGRCDQRLWVLNELWKSMKVEIQT